MMLLISSLSTYIYHSLNLTTSSFNICDICYLNLYWSDVCGLMVQSTDSWSLGLSFLWTCFSPPAKPHVLLMKGLVIFLPALWFSLTFDEWKWNILKRVIKSKSKMMQIICTEAYSKLLVLNAEILLLLSAKGNLKPLLNSDSYFLHEEGKCLGLLEGGLIFFPFVAEM